jgi:hypothetical protein
MPLSLVAQARLRVVRPAGARQWGWSTLTVARVDKRTVLIRAPGVELIEQVDGDRGFRQAGRRWGMGWDAIRK